MAKTWTVARFEFWTNVRRWEFLLLTLGLPLFSGLIIVLTSIPNYIYLQNKMNKASVVNVGYIDESHRFRVPDFVPASNHNLPRNPVLDPLPSSSPAGSGFHFVSYASPEGARKDLLASKIDYLYVIHNNYMESGDVDEMIVNRGVFRSERVPPLRTILEENLLSGKVDPALVQRVKEPMNKKEILLSPGGQVIDDPWKQEISDFFLPYGMMVLLLLSLVGSSSYLLRSVSEEKENRIMEILLSSVTPRELFFGKILGLGMLGLVQVGFWLLLALPVLGVILSYVKLSAAGIALFLVYFALGYMLNAGIIAGVGAIGSTEKESNQITGIFFLPSIVPMMVMPIILDDVSGIVSRVFSVIPFTSPIVMMVRMMREAPPVADVALSLAVLIGSILLVYRIALKIFRMGLLLYGKTPSLREIAAWVGQA